MSEIIGTAFVTFLLCFPLVPIALFCLEIAGFYTIVQERRWHVYVLFGGVVGVLKEPGLCFLPWHLGIRAFLVNWLGTCYQLDMRLDQEYLRSQAVNSEEGAPMGIGIWYEMYISDPVSYLFKNTDPRGSLAANVSNSVVRCLSNLKLSDMLENRHAMSQTVRTEVSAKSREWGYKTGSVYIRKVHFRDHEMIRQIESKVVNRLRQVTSAIRQDGANQVSIIASTAERQAAVEFGKAAAVRPEVVGTALREITQDEELANVLFQILDYEKMLESNARVVLVPAAGEILPQLLAASVKPGEQPVAQVGPQLGAGMTTGTDAGGHHRTEPTRGGGGGRAG